MSMRGHFEDAGHKASVFLRSGVLLALPLVWMLALATSLPMTAAAESDDERIDTVTEDGITYLGTPYHAWWDGETTAKWSSVKKAYRYQVRLYENDESVARVTVGGQSYDFTPYIKEGYRYYFEVRAVTRRYAQHYMDSEGEGWKQSLEMVGVSQGEVDGHWRYYQEGDKYQKKDGTFAAAGWLKIMGRWYFFDTNGYALKSQWIDDAGRRYCLQDDGAMAVGWVSWDGSWYYMGADGSMQTGWIQTNPGERYYLYPDGRMAASTQIDGLTIDENGLCKG